MTSMSMHCHSTKNCRVGHTIMNTGHSVTWFLLISTFVRKAAKRAYHLDQGQVVFLRQHFSIMTAEHCHRRSERILYELLGTLCALCHFKTFPYTLYKVSSDVLTT